VTKHRPWWSDSLRRAAALTGGLLLLNLPLSLWAADAPATKPLPAKKAAPARPAAKAKAAEPASEFGTAEIAEAELTGLHGSASFYGPGFHGQRTATGETFDMRSFTAASNRFPLGSWVAVRRLDNDRCAVVKVNDRMHSRHRKRIIDVSRSVADYLDMVRAGVVLVRVAPLKDGQRNDRTCHEAFEPATAAPDLSLQGRWTEPAPPPQLDAMQ